MNTEAHSALDEERLRGVRSRSSTNKVGGYLKTIDRTMAHLQSPANAPSKAESNPDYCGTIAYLNSDWRLVLCSEAFQWILQKKRGSNKWESKWFARTKAGLLRGIADKKIEEWGDINEAALRRVHELPEWI